MFKQTTIALSLAMVAGTGLAAQGTGTNTANTTNNSQAAAMSICNGKTLRACFNALDSNHDGVISRGEASANPALKSLYASFDTSDTLEKQAKKKHPLGGITFDQFKAGMEAASHGNIGPSVSGGHNYILMKNGTKKRVYHTPSGGTYILTANKSKRWLRKPENTMPRKANGAKPSMQNSANTSMGKSRSTPTKQGND